jgi:hypothetical protein
MIGCYPDFDVLEQADHWDAATREVILERVAPSVSYEFFEPAEVRTLSAFCDALLDQHSEPRIPMLASVDRKFAAGRGEGYRYAGMPADEEVWRMSARGLDSVALDRGGKNFAEIDSRLRHEIIVDFRNGDLSGESWDGLDVKRACAVLMRDAVAAFYEHPWAWNEIGFPGPAYPRGYSRIGPDMRETWEGREA